MKLTQRRIKELLNYDAEKGVITRAVTAGGKKAGTVIKSRNSSPCMKIDRVTYTLASIAWTYVHGEYPKTKLCYLNGNNKDLRIDNIKMSSPSSELTQGELKEVINYDPASGLITRVGITGSVCKIGEVMGFIGSDGYRMIKVRGRTYRAHRLAFLYMEGSLPPDCVDHINHIRSDNRFCNLRHVTRSENARNKTLSVYNKTGTSGVRIRRSGKFKATISKTTDGTTKNILLGQFDRLEDAVAVRKNAEKALGYHENHGLPVKQSVWHE